MALSDLAVRRAKTTGRHYTCADSQGLSLFVAKSGGKSWHFRYYWLGKQKRMSFGTYPAVSLAQARKLREEARALLAKGINPREDRKRKRQVARRDTKRTFEAVYEQWLRYRRLELEEGPQSTLAQIQRAFGRDVLPSLRRRAIFEVTRADLLEVIDRIEERKAFLVAEKVRTWLWQLFGYATVSVPGLEVNPASGLELVAAPLPPVRHNPFLRLPHLPKFLQKLRGYSGELNTQLAIRFLLLTGVRIGELRHALAGQFDLRRRLWIIPPSAVKQLKLQMRRARQRPEDVSPYVVPLSAQAIEIVQYLLVQLRPAQRYLLPGARSLAAPISGARSTWH